MDYRRKDKNMSKEICREIISVIWVKRRVVWVSWWQWNWRELGRIRIPFESTINQFSCSVMSDSLWPCDCSTPGLPVHHQLLELTQTHVHWVGGVIQTSHPLSSPSPPTFSDSQHQGLFQWVSSSHEVAKGLEFQLQHQSFQWIFRTDFL